MANWRILAMLVAAASVSGLAEGQDSGKKVPTWKEPTCWSGAEVNNPNTRGLRFPPLPVELEKATVSKYSVRLKLCIDGGGAVTRVIVLSSTGNPDVDSHFKKAASRWQVRPVVVDGRPVRTVARFSFAWNPQ